jgi:hypothetical protein
MNLFEGYDPGIFYDEMFAVDGGVATTVTAHCRMEVHVEAG